MGEIHPCPPSTYPGELSTSLGVQTWIWSQDRVRFETLAGAGRCAMRGGDGEPPDANKEVAVETPEEEMLPSRGCRRRLAGGGDGTLPLDSVSQAKLDYETRGWGVLPGVYRLSTILCGNWAH